MLRVIIEIAICIVPNEMKRKGMNLSSTNISVYQEAKKETTNMHLLYQQASPLPQLYKHVSSTYNYSVQKYD